MNKEIQTPVPSITLSPLDNIQKTLENRLKRLEVYSKIEIIQSDKVKFSQESEKRDLENEKITLENELLKKKGGLYDTPVGILLNASHAWVIDSEKTLLASEPALRSLWTIEELDTIKDLIMIKLKKL